MNYGKYNKYGAIKTTIDGITFDSRKEANRYSELKLLERAKEISNLKLQPEFELVPSQYKDGKCVERAVKYKADFSYTDKNGSVVIEDTKGFKTPEYIIKRKLMLYVYGYEVREI